MLRSILIMLFALGLNAQTAANAFKLQVLSTTDLHGHVLPQDSYTLQPVNLGWAKLATLIRARKAQNANTLLVDSGDAISGEPMNYIRNRLKPEWPEPSIAIMNALGCQAMAVGNHEFDFGFPLLRSVETQAKFPFLSANIVFADTGKSAFTAYAKVEVGGVQILILGLSSAMPSSMSDAAEPERLKLLDPVDTAKNLLPKLRQTEHPDVVIVAIHGGEGRSFDPVPRLAELVPGIDLILAGHTHQPLAKRFSGVPVLQAEAHGRALGVAELSVKKEKDRWIVTDCQLQLDHPTNETPQDPQVLDLTASLRAATDTYLNTFATDLAVDLDGRWSRMEDSALAQLLHAVQRQVTGAQLSAISSPDAKVFIPKGPTSVRQFYALMPYEDRVARIAITGAQLRSYLEHSAQFFNLSHLPDLFNRQIRPQDYDLVSGVNYTLDLSKPAGSRVVELTYRNAPVKDQQIFTLALSTYRLNGGGGYMEAIGFKGKAEVISTATFRNLLLEYVLSKPNLSIRLANNWHTVPYLDRERVLAQQP